MTPSSPCGCGSAGAAGGYPAPPGGGGGGGGGEGRGRRQVGGRPRRRGRILPPCVLRLPRPRLGTHWKAECQNRPRRPGPGEEVACSTNASSPCCARSSRTTSPPRSRWAPRPSSSGTTSGSPRPRSATTWPRWRTRATSPSRTPAPGGSRPTRATACSSTGWPRSSRCRPPSGARSRRSSRARSTSTTSWRARVRLLAQLTQQVAVVQYPSLTPLEVRHVEVVASPPTRMMLVVITSTGRVEQRLVELPARSTRTSSA